MAAFKGKKNRGPKAAATTRHDGGGQEKVGESYTEGDVFTKEEWGPIDDRGEKERDKEGDKEGDVRRRSKRDSKITPRMAAFKGKKNRGPKAATTTRHDGGGAGGSGGELYGGRCTRHHKLRQSRRQHP